MRYFFALCYFSAALAIPLITYVFCRYMIYGVSPDFGNGFFCGIIFVIAMVYLATPRDVRHGEARRAGRRRAGSEPWYWSGRSPR
jgi:hypothetical protein